MYKKLIEPFILGVVVSFFLFPISFTFLPYSFNTKQMLALLGAALYILDGIRDRKLLFPKEIFFAASIALLFSASCYYSVLFNGTSDMSYATYFVSFFVWLAGAYGMCSILRLRYKKLDIHTVIKYLMWVCVAQCISALLNDNVPAFKAAVGSVVVLGSNYLDDIGRMYGIGAALDPAGVRFSVVLLLVAFSLCEKIIKSARQFVIWQYVFCFFFIILVGNMISRTTTVGALLGLGYMFLKLGHIERGIIKNNSVRAILIILGFLIIAIPIVAYLYNTSPSMRSDLRFAFEGFFNWVETGVWRTASTDKLNARMWVWPDSDMDWIVGTGIFENYFYGTDIGYCRFILYCGLIGFFIFSIFFTYNAIAFNQKFDNVELLAFLLFAMTFIIWIKVATDIFQIYAILFCIDAISTTEEDDTHELEEES